MWGALILRDVGDPLAARGRGDADKLPRPRGLLLAPLHLQPWWGWGWFGIKWLWRGWVWGLGVRCLGFEGFGAIFGGCERFLKRVRPL